MGANEESDRFKFAAATLTALGTFLSAIFIYFQKYAVEDYLYAYASLIIPITSIPFIFFFVYLLMKGLSTGLPYSNKNNLKILTTSIYLSAFALTIIILILILSFILLVRNPSYGIIFIYLSLIIILYFLKITINLNMSRKIIQGFRCSFDGILYFLVKKSKWVYNFHFIKVLNEILNEVYSLPFIKKVVYFIKKPVAQINIIISLCVMLVLYCVYLIYRIYVPQQAVFYIPLTAFLVGFVLYKFILPKEYFKWVATIVTISILIGILLWTYSIPPFLYFTKGDVKIDMNSIYYKKGEPIPVSIDVTGRNTRLSIYLNASSDHNLTEIGNITLEPTHDSNIIELGKILTGNAFDSGKYDIFINTTNLSEGYYEFVVLRFKDEYKYGKSFYLLNASLLNTSEK